ncbi:unnamed protein product [Paramecium sonneborni]|uniref:Homeodomain protein n=1 Tax=Paramecium sonneborni TaxID=65129 RepID=A0A8S1QV68_9CILI|nr:unnamed protein product [Paramecium sonneborni]
MKMDGSENAKYLIHFQSIIKEPQDKQDRDLQIQAKKIQNLGTQKIEIQKRKLILDQTDTTSIKQKCIKKRNKIYENKKIRRPWSAQEDQQLQLAIQQHGSNWIQIAASLMNRNPSQCAQRWKRIKPSDLKKRKPFSIKEDQIILELVSKYTKNWGKIAQYLPEKTSKQIRERYINKLNPQIKFEPFTEEEDQIIINAYREIGSKWSKIQDLLIGRPENMIKNRFYSYLRQKFLKIKNPYYAIPQQIAMENKSQQSSNNEEQQLSEEKQQIETQFEIQNKENNNQRNKCNQNIQPQVTFSSNQYFQIPCPILYGNYSYPQFQYYQTPIALVYTPIQQDDLNVQNSLNTVFQQQIIFGQNVTNQLVFQSNS